MVAIGFAQGATKAALPFSRNGCDSDTTNMKAKSFSNHGPRPFLCFKTVSGMHKVLSTDGERKQQQQ